MITRNTLVTISSLVLVATVPLSVIAQTSTIKPSSTQAPVPTRVVIQPSGEPVGGINMTVSPVFMDLTTDPGKIVGSQFKVRNNNNFTEYLKIRLAKFEAYNGDRPRIIELTDQDEYSQWIRFSEEEFEVKPGETKTIKFTIDPPASASLGYYYSVMLTRIKDVEGNIQGAVVTGAPAISILLDVRSPNAKRELQLVDFKTDKAFYEYLPANFQVSVKNTGNIHLVPSGNIFIDWGGEKDVAILKANETRGNILPQTRRVYTASWDDGFIMEQPKTEDGKVVMDQKGGVARETKWDFTKADKFRIGKYTAHLLMTYDNGQRDVPLEATISFWIIPWKLLSIAAVILIFAFIGLKNTVVTNVKKILGLFGKGK